MRISATRSGKTLKSVPVILTATLALVAVLLPRAVAAGSNSPAGSCNIVSGGISSGGNTVICNFGMPPEQLKATIEAAVNGGLIDRLVDISKTLGVTESAAKTLLKIVGEDPNIPADKLAEALSNVATTYRRLKAQVAALNPDNLTARALVDQAKPEIDAGHFQRARELLRQATLAQIAGAQEASKLREQARAAEDAQMLGAASSTAAEGDVAMTERRYKEGADLFAQAAGYVPSRRANEEGDYLTREAAALYRQGDEAGDNDALRRCIEIYGHALGDYPRSQAALSWAATQMGLRSALSTLGERESGMARLEERAAAFRAALEEYSRDQLPLNRAMAQMGLGTALSKLGEREVGTARLKEAVGTQRGARGSTSCPVPARVGRDAEQSRQHVGYARRARERNGAA
jgi:tetratricopeptide (TPR) repeat protein